MPENSGIPSAKSALREHARALRSATDFAKASRDVAAHISALPEFGAARNVLIYLAMPVEINVEALIDNDAGEPKTWYVPRCEAGRRLTIHRFASGHMALRSGPFGIREPAPESQPIEDIGIIDLVLVPGLLYTAEGARLGNGGGYYDRFLPLLTPGCVTVGVIPSRQIVDALPDDSWDIRVSAVVTERGVVRPELPV